jgi:hypothetical protein
MTGPSWDDIRSELLALVEEDQRVRAELVAEGSLFDGYHPRMRAVHEANAEGERPPGDWHARRHGMEEWLREVGWRR